MRIAAGAALVLPDGRWVMQRRTDDAPTDPDLLSFFGGGLEGDEEPEQALIRELNEETSLALPEKKYLLICDPIVIRRDGHELKLYVYTIEIPSMDFKVFEGKRAEAYLPSDLRKREDISEVAQLVLQAVSEK